ncbi:MAG: hydrogenase nickel incorporation protein HypB [Candidatus Stygibacter australis]|nr:hydrogenase nickel incorporation protein HypB [Candidatus Stygibacter australis]MDP8322303.1 hydrogenase nickel incorporation protein HypB [Candidatus Stygibacter australis]
MEKREIKVMEKILSANDRVADGMRAEMEKKGILSINLMSSPGSGKTSLLERTSSLITEGIFAIEGDIQTTLDAERLVSAGIASYQINTGPFGGDCHLEAGWIQNALQEIDLSGIDYLFVENIGNLVCPAEFDVGAHLNGVVLSVTEGEDKPLKYPLAFRNSQFCLISKVDLLPYLDINMQRMINNVLKINPEMEIIILSSKTGEGMEDWVEFLEKNKKS